MKHYGHNQPTKHKCKLPYWPMRIAGSDRLSSGVLLSQGLCRIYAYMHTSLTGLCNHRMNCCTADSPKQWVLSAVVSGGPFVCQEYKFQKRTSDSELGSIASAVLSAMIRNWVCLHKPDMSVNPGGDHHGSWPCNFDTTKTNPLPPLNRDPDIDNAQYLGSNWRRVFPRCWNLDKTQEWVSR